MDGERNFLEVNDLINIRHDVQYSLMENDEKKVEMSLSDNQTIERSTHKTRPHVTYREALEAPPPLTPPLPPTRVFVKVRSRPPPLVTPGEDTWCSLCEKKKKKKFLKRGEDGKWRCKSACKRARDEIS